MLVCYPCGRPAWVMSARAAVIQTLLQEAAVQCVREVEPFLKAPDVMVDLQGRVDFSNSPSIFFATF